MCFKRLIHLTLCERSESQNASPCAILFLLIQCTATRPVATHIRCTLFKKNPRQNSTPKTQLHGVLKEEHQAPSTVLATQRAVHPATPLNMQSCSDCAIPTKLIQLGNYSTSAGWQARARRSHPGPPMRPHLLLRWMLTAFTIVASHAGRALMRFTYAATDGHSSKSTYMACQPSVQPSVPQKVALLPV